MSRGRCPYPGGNEENDQVRAVLVSRQALWVGLGTAPHVAGMGRPLCLACHLGRSRDSADAAASDCIRRLHPDHGRPSYTYLLRQRRTPAMAVGRLRASS